MKPAPFEYHRPASLVEALTLKAQFGAAASILAGGQSLVPVMSMRMAQPEVVIDLGAIDDLAYVARHEGGLRVGAMTRTRVLEQSPVVREVCPLLPEAVQHVAHPVIRNRGTVGGSIAHADPAAELPAVLAVLGGSVIARSAQAEREIAADALFRGHFTTALEPDEILTEVRFPALAPGAGYAFDEIVRRHGDFALAGVAAVATAGTMRIALFGVDSRPIVLDDGDGDLAAERVRPTDDVHGSAEYRRKLVRVLVTAATQQAQQRAGS